MSTLSEDMGLSPMGSLDEETRRLQYTALKDRLVLLARGRVQVSYLAWSEWHVLEQKALADATEIVDAQRAVDKALAEGGQAAKVYGVVDGGDAQLEAALGNLAERTLGKAKG